LPIVGWWSSALIDTLSHHTNFNTSRFSKCDRFACGVCLDDSFHRLAIDRLHACHLK